MKRCLVAALLALSSYANASPVFVGNWHVGDGPQWNASVQTAYSGQAAAALLFGGNASDYFISTISDQVADINHMAWMDQYGYGIGGILSESFSDGAQYTSGVHSAYIQDNSCGVRYNNPNAVCNDNYVNYAFFNAPTAGNVPEPASIALFSLALFGVAAARRKSAD